MQNTSPKQRKVKLRITSEILAGNNFDFFLMRYILSQKTAKIYLELNFFKTDFTTSAQTIPMNAPSITSLGQCLPT